MTSLWEFHGKTSWTRKRLWNIVLGWLPRIANGLFQRSRYPRIASWVILSRPCGTQFGEGSSHPDTERRAISVLELEEFAQAPGLGATHWDLSLLAIIHAQLIAALEPGYDFLDVVDVHYVGTVGSPENGWIQQLQ
jgi:hypothetical protein